MTRAKDTAVDHLFLSGIGEAEEGIWVGVDFGTSNCACAVWDSAGGRAKWIRFPKHLAKLTPRGKNGRTMPSAVLFGKGDSLDGILEEEVVIGQMAFNVVDDILDAYTTTDSSKDAELSAQDVSEALVTSVKRILGVNFPQLNEDKEFVQSLPFSIESTENEEVVIKIRPLNKNKEIQVTPLQVTTILLQSIRFAAQMYLDTLGKRKGLQVPGRGQVRNVVVGVPAHFGRSQRKLMEKACRLAGWDGHVSTITESTAAAMSYGLFVSSPSEKSILVVDIGGGTTDLTICSMKDGTFHVVVTAGDKRLGGDDMDELLLRELVKKYQSIHGVPQAALTTQQRRYLLRACRQGKERLCGGADGSTDPPAESCTIIVNKHRVQVTQQEFNTAIESFIQHTRDLVKIALQRFASVTNSDASDTAIDEVVLVGGATRVPAIRTMLQQEFPLVELCTSVSAESAVAQGAAIQAALQSGLVPRHELQSALMLDALPHSIGVQLDDGSFLSVLEKDAPLPAMGYTTFTLASVHQPGVTLTAVENVGDDMPHEPIGEFSFLLKRLSGAELSKIGDKRTVDIGMTMEPNGEFIVSIFDSNDPEHLEKKRRYQKQKVLASLNGRELGYRDETIKHDKLTRDEWFMMICVAILFVFYSGVKLIFHDPLDESKTMPTGKHG